MAPKLTIGMAVYDDFDGVFFTVQALRLYHDLSNVELLVVDNLPNSPAGEMTRGLIENWASDGTAGARYIAMPEPTGTTQPRNRVFDEASGDAVMCVDSHVMLAPGSIARLLNWYDSNPANGDLLSGPMLLDNFAQIATQFDDVWNAEMWGTWGSDERGVNPYAPPFEIFAQGLGLFTCRRSAWLGFNREFRGFGGEECYIHTKYRQAGRKCLCLPFLRWAHRFGRPGGVKYPLTRENKIRNYILGHRELGLPLDRAREHFVGGGLVSAAEWAKAESDPLRYAQYQPSGGCGTCGSGVSKSNREAPPAPESIGEIFAHIARIPRDLNEHMAKLRELASQAGRVTEFTSRRESTVAFLAAEPMPRRLVSYQKEDDAVRDHLHRLVLAKNNADPSQATEFTTVFGGDSLKVDKIEPTDLLFIDTAHNAERVYAELTRHAEQVSARIVFHDTAIYGEKGDDGGPGLLVGIRRWLAEHPEWSVIYHTNEQYGLTVISRDPADKPKLPGVVRMGVNFAKALAEHVASGAKMAPKELAEYRAATCLTCEHRRDDRCSVCGCFIAEKAAWETSECPLGKWPEAVPADGFTVDVEESTDIAAEAKEAAEAELQKQFGG